MLWYIGCAAGSIIRCGRSLCSRTLDRARLQRTLETGSRLGSAVVCHGGRYASVWWLGTDVHPRILE